MKNEKLGKIITHRKNPTMSNKRKVIVTDDSEMFTKSGCACQFCQDIHTSNTEWEKFEITTRLQRGMKDVVKRIEDRERMRLLENRMRHKE